MAFVPKDPAAIEDAIDDVIRASAVHPREVLTAEPQFRAPEQWLGTHVDDRTDVWALGVLLFERLTGTFPFEGPNETTLAAHIVGTGASRLRDRRPDVSPALEYIVGRCLEKDPAARYRDVAELIEDLNAHDAPVIQPRLVRIENFIAEVRNSLRPRRVSLVDDGPPPNFTPARTRMAVGGRIAAAVTTALIVAMFALFAHRPIPALKTMEAFVATKR